MSLLRGLLKYYSSCQLKSIGTECSPANEIKMCVTGVCCPVHMNKRSMFGVYDNIGILGNWEVQHQIMGFRGNELQRLTRKKRMKRIRFLYRHFKRFGKHR
uniref:Large ribosomal subunit protein mL51 n=1 Tax=Oncorhynchus tshawytscha TaxID=74940 RepID=A0A8C8MM09_ONCTS